MASGKRKYRRNRGVTAWGWILLLISLAALPAPAQSDNLALQIFALTNRDRQEHGLPPLQWDTNLAAAARAHDKRMVRESALSHQYSGEPDLMARAASAGAHFRAVAENIATGPTPEAIENEWMHSPLHRANILDPQMSALGVAVERRGGTLYAVEDFARTSPVLSIREVEQRVSELLREHNVDPSRPASMAEQACRMARGMPSGTNARSMVRFQTPSLTQLPLQVAEQIRRGNYHSAAVGACSPENPGSFTLYRVAILFF